MKTTNMLLTLIIIAVVAFGLYLMIGTSNVSKDTDTKDSVLEVKIDDNQ